MSSNIEEDTEPDNMSDPTQLDQIVETKRDSEQLPEEENPPTDKSTPYQLLNLMVGNAEELSFHYTVYTDDKPEGETVLKCSLTTGEESLNPDRSLFHTLLSRNRLQYPSTFYKK